MSDIKTQRAAVLMLLITRTIRHKLFLVATKYTMRFSLQK